MENQLQIALALTISDICLIFQKKIQNYKYCFQQMLSTQVNEGTGYSDIFTETFMLQYF